MYYMDKAFNVLMCKNTWKTLSTDRYYWLEIWVKNNCSFSFSAVEEFNKMAAETLTELDWCLEQLELVQTHRSISDMATSKVGSPALLFTLMLLVFFPLLFDALKFLLPLLIFILSSFVLFFLLSFMLLSGFFLSLYPLMFVFPSML